MEGCQCHTSVWEFQLNFVFTKLQHMNTIRLLSDTVENYRFPNTLDIDVLEDPNGSWSYELL